MIFINVIGYRELLVGNSFQKFYHYNIDFEAKSLAQR
jgi:hypothetical protein